MKTSLLAAGLLLLPAIASCQVLFRDSFETSDGPVDLRSWEVTSGQWRVAGRRAYSDSPVFRADTRRANFGDVDVSFTLINQGLTTGGGESWHGVHMFLRRQSQYHTYYLSVNRRDNRALIKKKVPGGSSNGGTYYDLASASFPVPYDRPQRVLGRVVNNPDGSVSVSLFVDGRRLMTAVDRGIGGPPIRRPGGTGVRGDYTRFYTDDFTVAPSGSAAGTGPGPDVDHADAKAAQRFLSPALADGINDTADFGPEAEEVTVVDPSGREVRRLSQPGGGLSWDCRDSAGRVVDSGVYVALIRTRDGSRTAQSFAVVK